MSVYPVFDEESIISRFTPFNISNADPKGSASLIVIR